MEIFGKADIFCQWAWQIKDDTSSNWHGGNGYSVIFMENIKYLK